MDIIPQKCCVKCKTEKPFSDFNRNSTRLDGRRTDCKSCQVKATFESRRRRKWFIRYGMTMETYQTLFDMQGGVCAICHKPETGKANNGKTRLLAVDHCHENGNIRGLLCGKCNRIIGELGDDPLLFRAMADYLDHYSGE